MLFYLFLAIVLLTTVAYFVGRSTGRRFVADGTSHVDSVPSYHGVFVALWVGVPALALVLIWAGLRESLVDRLVLSRLPASNSDDTRLVLNEAHALVTGDPLAQSNAAAEMLKRWETIANGALFVFCIAGMLVALFLARRHLSPRFRARRGVEQAMSGLMIASSIIALLTMAGIIFCLIFEAWTFFERVPPREFFLGPRWEPQIAIRDDQIAGGGLFGAVPVFVGTAMVALIAMAVALPIAIFSAVYLFEYASHPTRAVLKPLLEVLAGMPTVVYGFFAVVTVAPWIQIAGTWAGLTVSINSALAVGIVTGIMIIPTISALTDDALRAVPRALRDGSLAIGATSTETMRHVMLPAALPGIMGGVLFALSRAIGETMIVLMAGGLIASLTPDPLASTTTMTAEIVTLLIGDTTFDNPKTLAAFALGLVLFVVTLGLNVVAFGLVRRYRGRTD